ncbi:hypothetical protein AXG93_2139s1220 [Marchantia polymorpha subsp. ruderalis]|nr:hypothetical protein AXG93_2139s1220 [Marchantia polymorpha subsp. ruderalis]
MRCRSQVFILLVVTVIAPLIFLAGRATNFNSTVSSHKDFDVHDLTTDHGGELRRLNALEHIETLFPKEVLKVIYSHTEETGALNMNLVGRKDLASSLIQEETAEDQGEGQVRSVIQDQGEVANQEQGADDIKVSLAEVEAEVGGRAVDLHSTEDDSAKETRKQFRHRRHEKRLTELIRQDEDEDKKAENEAMERNKEVEVGVDGKFSIWKREDAENPDAMVRIMRDQLIMARAYAAIAESTNNGRLLRELKAKIKENIKLLGEANVDSELPPGIKDKIKLMARLLTKARDQHRDCAMMVKKLRAMLQTSEEHARTLKKQSTFLSQLAAKTIPKGLHCLSMSLTLQYHLLPLAERELPESPKLEDPTLYHYAIFSDNILAAAVVVNSTIIHAKEPEKHVFHVVTDRMNFGAMKMWFLENSPGLATIQVENVDDYKWLNASYCPVLHQLSSASMKDYYFKADNGASLATVSSNLKYRNPKYLSMLNHLRFYLPEVFPKLNKVLFLDDDVVVQKDLSALWDVDLHGNVNGAVETCGQSFHRFDKYLNFSHPDIASNFDPMACGWAYGMNMFDLVEWKKRDITGIYHKWQRMNEDRTLWKLGTLPPGLITFYNMTFPLDKSWHVLGLGYNPGVLHSELEAAAVVHYNGNMKPWLEIGMSRYKPYWTKYVKYDHPSLQQCNINE